jgi:ParB family transcriptional regulator, chromosome partitioning protein
MTSFGDDVNLKINPEYASIMTPLTEWEYERLKKSIKKHGLIYPIIVNQDNVILDGYYRYKACKELGIKPRVEVKRFEETNLINRFLDEKKYIIEINLERTHIN